VAKQFDQYTDTEVIDEVIKGKAPLYEILIRRYNPYLYKAARSYGFNHHDAEDLMQETYVAAFTNLAKFENRSSFKTWILRILLNQCFHKMKKLSFKNERISTQYINENSTPMYANDKSDTGRSITNRELREVLEDSVQKLPEDYRMVFALRELSGLNVEETAELLGISEANVKVRLNRARTLLRKEIEKTYSADELFEFNLIYCDNIVARVLREINYLTVNNE
jgi:RNA polymerase sigma factor (sigma-70 family)